METPAKMDMLHRYQQLKNRISELAAEARHSVELLAVSKGQAAASLRALHACGQVRFGENYSQELISKSEQLQDLKLEWVYIGHLQSNKIRKIVSIACEIQTVGSLRQAEQIARHAKELGKVPYPIWMEVNAAAEQGKHGCMLADVPSLAAAIAALPELQLKGIMSIPPAHYQDSEAAAEPELYQELRQLASSVGQGQLSLGMSGDLKMAIQAGSNQVRIGTALFGPRQV